MPVRDREGNLPTPRLPRLGVIRLGYKQANKNGKGEHPVAANYFVLNDDEKDNCGPVIEVYGDKPTSMDIMFPGDDEEAFAPHWLRSYSATWGLVCMGDRRTATRKVGITKDGEKEMDGDWPACASRNSKEVHREVVPCSCPRLEKGDCRETMYLRFVLLDVPGVGVWQISTGSWNSIQNIQGMFSILRGMYGRISGIPLTLTIGPRVVTSDTAGRKTVQVLSLGLSERMTPRQLLADLAERPMLNPVIDIPDDDQETAPEDAMAEGNLVPPETEEAEYLNKAEMAAAKATDPAIEMARAAGHHIVEDENAESGDAPATEPPEDTNTTSKAPAGKKGARPTQVQIRDISTLCDSYEMPAATHLPLILGMKLGEYMKENSFEEAVEAVKERGEARKANLEAGRPADA